MNRRRSRTPPISSIMPTTGTDYHQRLQSQVDLAELDEITDENLVSCLRERYMSDIIYTRIGPSAIIALNPHKPISSGDSLSREYVSRYYVSTSTAPTQETKEGAAEGIHSNGNGKEALPPHVYELAVNAYYDMRRTSQDQSIIFTGETGSGKSHTAQLITQTLLSLSAAPSGKKHHKLSFQIPSADFILTSFGHSRTLLNPTSSSRFGRYTELQYSGRGRLCGSKVIDYYLERGRVVAPTHSVGERNFHVFYYLLGGVEGEERTKLKLDFNKKTPFRYLGQHSRLQPTPTRGGGVTDGATNDSDHLRYDQLKSSLGAIGISKRHIPQIFQLLSTILHVGNLDFVIDRGRDEDAAVVRNTDILDIVSDFLGVSSSELEGALAYKTRTIASGTSGSKTGSKGRGTKVEVYTVCLDPEAASDNRDDLAKFLYSLLFSWLVEQINKKLCSKDVPPTSPGSPADAEGFHTFIGLLDFPGSQNLTVRPNGFDQFCINLANEKLNWWIYQRMFTEKDDEFISEGLPQFASTPATSALPLSLSSLSSSLPGGSSKGFKAPPTTSGECVRLYQHHPGGLLHIMDDQTRRIPRKTDWTMVEAIQKRWGNHSLFKAYLPEAESDSKDQAAAPSSSTPATFTITHFNGPVTYSAQTFLERNLNAVNPNFVSLLWGTQSTKASSGRTTTQGGEGGSTNPFIRALFSKELVNMQLLDRDEDIVVGAQQSAKPVRSPSTKRRGGRKGRRLENTTLALSLEGTIEEEGAGEVDADAAGLQRADTYKSVTTGEHSNPESNSNSPLKPTLSEFNSTLSTLFTTLSETQSWFVYCVNPNDSQLPNQFEVRSVRGQVKSLLLGGVARKMTRGGGWFEAGVEKEEFWERYGGVLNAADGDGRVLDTADGDGSEDDYGADDVDGTVEGEERRTPKVKKSLAEVKQQLGLQEGDIVAGKYKIFLTHPAFHALEDLLRQTENEQPPRHFEDPSSFGFKGIDLYALDESTRQPRPPAARTTGANYDLSSPNLPLIGNQSLGSGLLPYRDQSPRSRSLSPNPPGLGRDYYSDPDEPDESVTHSSWGARSRASYTVDDTPMRDKSGAIAEGKHRLLAGEPKGFEEGNTQLVMKESSARRRWVGLCRFFTWWIPDKALEVVGRMKREDVRQAWREKLTINFLIWIMCGIVVFVLVFLVKLICPPQHVFNPEELATHTTQENPGAVYTAIRGEVFDLGIIADQHARTIPVVPEMNVLQYGGQMADPIFPVQVSALCNGINGTVSPFVVLSIQNVTDPNAQYHDFTIDTASYQPDWYFENMVIMRWTARVGFVGYTPQAIKSMASAGSSVAAYEGHVYDLTNYIANPPVLGSPPGTQPPAADEADTNFMDDAVVQLFTQNAGSDVTKALNNLNIDSATLARQKVCLRNLFMVGMVDTRDSVQCQFSTYILLAMSALMLSVISFKFLASVNLGAPRAPQDHDKFVICQVPCYTEGELSLRRTIDSLAKTKYDDKRKLIVVICDGMIVGSGNDKPTPRIVLDILGSDPNLDPEPLSFVSLGEGAKQHNMGKVYTGLYEVAGHVVPYLVIVKCGKPGERSRPGNRGKRDSQMVLMHFLNKVHFNSPMNPLELEIYHQVKNIIGVNPTFYEYLFTVDADTTVEQDSLNRLISAMVRDKKLLGVCGETSLANAKQSIITMMQVYEYFLSHHMAKAFESLFGSVTCLPGCFTLYRLRTPDNHKPLLISNSMIQDYSENRVDTLHMKNLLHLGEDRYLTTLLLKHFPTYRTQFVRDAHAYTVAPDDWKVLLSQRRRWINSTVHNLGELVFLEQLCGFCCFSMRFVVLIDLVSTIIQPVTVAYIGYLIYLVTAGHEQIPPISLAMIGAIYGLQALVFIFRRKWDMVGWMLFYILAIPAFSFMLPLYSFWKMDDFSWGATRIVLGDAGKKIVIHDEGKFDPQAIPLQKWSDYEGDLWDQEDNHSIGSWVPPYAKDANANGRQSQTASLYGRETVYEPMAKSPALSSTPLPGYQSPKGYASPRASQSQLYMPVHPQQPSAPFSNSRPSSRLHTRESMASINRMATPPPRVTSGLGPRRESTSPPPMRSTASRPVSLAPPSDHQIDIAVQEILRTADLNTTTKREIRKLLEEKFGMDLASRKTVINTTVDRHLLART